MENFHGIFEYKYLEICDDFSRVFDNVTFLVDCGKYKAGDTVERVYFKYDTLTAHTTDNTELEFKLVPTEPVKNVITLSDAYKLKTKDYPKAKQICILGGDCPEKQVWDEVGGDGVKDGDIIYDEDTCVKYIWWDDQVHPLSDYPYDYENVPEFVKITETQFNPYYWIEALGHSSYVWFSDDIMNKLEFVDGKASYKEFTFVLREEEFDKNAKYVCFTIDMSGKIYMKKVQVTSKKISLIRGRYEEGSSNI